MKKIFLSLLLALLFLPFFSSAQQAKVLSDREKKQVVWRHNYWRKQVDMNMPKMKWSRTLAMAAKIWANELGKDCEMRHSTSKYGENIFWGSTSFSAQAVVDAWAEERHDYDYENNTCKDGEQCGHYTQMVWKTTTEVGCAKIRCSNGNEIWVCVYDPAGNIVGEKPY